MVGVGHGPVIAVIGSRRTNCQGGGADSGTNSGSYQEIEEKQPWAKRNGLDDLCSEIPVHHWCNTARS